MRIFPWLRFWPKGGRDPDGLDDLEKRLGYRFKNRHLLRQALTHRSITDQPPDNLERLEYLGDAVLEHVVSVYLYHNNPRATEGELTMGRSALVNKDFLAEAGEVIGLHNYLRVEGGVRLDDPKVRRNLVGDATESIIGALYLDGGMSVVERFIHRKIVKRLSISTDKINFKGELIELCHQRNLGKPRFQLLETRGPEHNKLFVIQVRVGDITFSPAESDTKKAAEQAAAESAIKELESSEIS